jgi:TRAP-type mannitol/chloroaromatic compound transport system permease small subunit
MRLSKLKRVVQLFDRILNRVNSFCLTFSGVLIVIMACSTTYGALRRYLFRNPEPYTYELAAIILLFSSMLSMAHTQKLRRNITIDLIQTYIPKKVCDILDIIGLFMGIVFCAVFVWTSLDFSLFGLQSGETTRSSWRFPIYPLEMIIPIAMLLVFLVLISQFIRSLTSLVGKARKKQEKLETPGDSGKV